MWIRCPRRAIREPVKGEPVRGPGRFAAPALPASSPRRPAGGGRVRADGGDNGCPAVRRAWADRAALPAGPGHQAAGTADSAGAHRGEPVSPDRLIDALLGDGPAANPHLQAQIGQRRRTLGPAAIVTTEACYALAIGPDHVDVVRFEQLVVMGRRLAEAGEMAQAQASGPRRGEPLAEFAYSGFAGAQRTGAAGRADPGGDRNPGRSGTWRPSARSAPARVSIATRVSSSSCARALSAKPE